MARFAKIVGVVFVVLLTIGILIPEPPKEVKPAAAPPVKKEAPSKPKPAPKPAPAWSMINFVDEFGTRSGDRGAISKAVTSNRTMSFPYTDTKAQLYVNCTSAWIRFTESPNLTNGELHDGYSVMRVAVRVDGKDAGYWRVSQPWGSKDLNFREPSKVISTLSSAGTVAISLAWYGESSAAFRWSLTGSTDAIKSSCE